MPQAELNIVTTQTWWHGSRDMITAFEDSPQGLHFGSRAQAEMRNRAYLHEVSIRPSSVTRIKDRQDWSSVVAAARRRARDASLYLNRSEGLSLDRVTALASAGLLDRIDDISEVQFRRAVPEAEDSVVVFFADVVRLERVLDPLGAVAWERTPLQQVIPPDDDGPRF